MRAIAPIAPPTMPPLSPLVAAHLLAALAALVIGPIALWGTRKGSRSHRAAGYLWVALMVATAATAAGLRDHGAWTWGGFSPIHLLVPFVAYHLVRGLWAVAHGQIERHRKHMRGLYLGGCLVAGAFTLLPGRYLGDLLWTHTFNLLA